MDALHEGIGRLSVPTPKWGSGGRALESLRPDHFPLPEAVAADATVRFGRRSVAAIYRLARLL